MRILPLTLCMNGRFCGIFVAFFYGTPPWPCHTLSFGPDTHFYSARLYSSTSPHPWGLGDQIYSARLRGSASPHRLPASPSGAGHPNLLGTPSRLCQPSLSGAGRPNLL